MSIPETVQYSQSYMCAHQQLHGLPVTDLLCPLSFPLPSLSSLPLPSAPLSLPLLYPLLSLSLSLPPSPSLLSPLPSATLSLSSPLPTSPPGTEDRDVLREMILSSRTARCRSRFVVPVILLCDHTHICRSATLSTYAELCGRQGYDWLSSECVSVCREMESDRE